MFIILGVSYLGFSTVCKVTRVLADRKEKKTLVRRLKEIKAAYPEAQWVPRAPAQLYLNHEDRVMGEHGVDQDARREAIARAKELTDLGFPPA